MRARLVWRRGRRRGRRRVIRMFCVGGTRMSGWICKSVLHGFAICRCYSSGCNSKLKQTSRF